MGAFQDRFVANQAAEQSRKVDDAALMERVNAATAGLFTELMGDLSGITERQINVSVEDRGVVLRKSDGKEMVLLALGDGNFVVKEPTISKVGFIDVKRENSDNCSKSEMVERVLAWVR